jgi:hypothetical protein
MMDSTNSDKKCMSCEQYKKIVQLYQFFVHDNILHKTYTSWKFKKEDFENWKNKYWIEVE